MPERVHIIGMYKSGTSWLLEALCQLPGTVGLSEIDILKAVSENVKGTVQLRSPADRIEYIFGGTSWCALPMAFHEKGAYREFLTGAEIERLPQQDLRFGDLPATLIVTLLQRMVHHRKAGKSPGESPELGADGVPKQVPLATAPGNRRRRPCGFRALDEANLVEMIDAIRAADCIPDAAEAFAKGIERGFPDADRLVFKAADQISRQELLMEWRPDDRKIMVVRDGRDVAISALHYRDLMANRQMPWNQAGRERPKDEWGKTRGGEPGVLAMRRQLSNWVIRVGKGLELETEGKLLLVRYEDIRRNFTAEFSRVLEYLEEPHDEMTLERVRESTRFDKSRKKNAARKGNVKRKGAVEEWRSVMGVVSKLVAWQVAGGTLRRMGYGFVRRLSELRRSG